MGIQMLGTSSHPWFLCSGLQFLKVAALNFTLMLLLFEDLCKLLFTVYLRVDLL